MSKVARNVDGLSMLYDVLEPVFEAPCCVCNRQGGYAAVSKEGSESTEFAVAGCEVCVLIHPVFKNRMLLYTKCA